MAAGRGKRALFGLAAVVGVPLVLLLALEGGLRLAGFGFDPDFFVARTVDGQRVLTDNPRFGWRFFPPELAREPNPFSIPAEKPPGTVRVFVLGGSAAMGDPAPPSGLPRVLQAMLEAGRPDLRIEVVNAAMTAINSHVVLPIARDCLEHGDADVLVVYLGNNEVVGPFGAGSVFGVPGAGWRVARANVALMGTRLGQLVDRIARALPRRGAERPDNWKGMELFLGTRLERDDPRLQVVAGNFGRNLRDLVAAAAARGVPVVLSTVGVNRAACPPFGSSDVDDPAWQRDFDEGVVREDAGDVPAALEAYARAEASHPEHAELRYRAARCRWAEGDSAGAAEEYAEALDLDVLRFRADSAIDRVIRETAADAPAGAVTLVDGAAALAAAAPGGLPAAGLFDDHVHPNFRGNLVLGEAIARAVLPLLPDASGGGAGAGSLPDSAAVAARIGYGPWERVPTLQLMQGRRKLPPFAGQLDEAEWAARIADEIRDLTPDTEPWALRKAVAALRDQLGLHPDDWMLRDELADLLLRTGDVPGALREREDLARRFPYRAGMRYGLGEALARAGRGDEAMDAYRQAIALDPRHFLAQNRLGEELMDRGRPEEALPHFEAAVRAGPQLGIAHRNLGDALLKLDRPEEAVSALRDAIAVNPELAAAHKKLGDALSRLGRRDEAEASYREALRLNPDYRAARERLEALESAP